jgi:hypothetical protein
VPKSFAFLYAYCLNLKLFTTAEKSAVAVLAEKPLPFVIDAFKETLPIWG